MRIALVSLTVVIAACGGAVEDTGGNGARPRMSTGFADEGGSFSPSSPNLGGRGSSSGSGGIVSVTDALPTLPGQLYAIGSGQVLYRIDLQAQTAEPVDSFGRTRIDTNCENHIVRDQFAYNDLATDTRGRLIAGGAVPFVRELGRLSLVDPATAEIEDILQLPTVPQGITVTSRGWLAFVGDGLGQVDLETGRFVQYLVAPGRLMATGGLVELDGKLLFPVAPSGHATYDLESGELQIFESSFDGTYQGLAVVDGAAYALLTDGRILPIDVSGPVGSPVMFENAWYGATARRD